MMDHGPRRRPRGPTRLRVSATATLSSAPAMAGKMLSLFAFMWRQVEAETAYIVEARVDELPILAAAPFPPANSEWAQVFNPTWVAPSPATGNKSGLLVRSQNCTDRSTAAGSCGPTCSGDGQHASWLTWAELAEDGGAASKPRVTNHVTAASAVFGPFDCEPGGPSKTHCPDERGTEDPRLTYDEETGDYVLLYNAWGRPGALLSVATTKDPTRQTGWTRHGTIFPAGAKIAGWPAKSGSIVTMPAGPHYVIWGCARALRITPSVGRSMLQWDYQKSKLLFSVRPKPYWDGGFVESAMPPLTLSDGNMIFFYDSVGPWNGTSGFQPGWAILNGSDPTQVLARASVPPLPYVLPWEAGVRPQWPCNTRHVSNLGGGHAVPGPNPMGGGDGDLFRVYFGGADAVVGSALISVQLAPGAGNFSCVHEQGTGLSQCLPTDGVGSAGLYPSFSECTVACGPPPPPPPPTPADPMKPGVLCLNTDIFGDNVGHDKTSSHWEECRAACVNQKGCFAFTFDNRTSCPEGACCWFKGPAPQPQSSPGRLSMLLPKALTAEGET
jgi:predicted GH43/DUF377 family glycosyl hydrolase